MGIRALWPGERGQIRLSSTSRDPLNLMKTSRPSDGPGHKHSLMKTILLSNLSPSHFPGWQVETHVEPTVNYSRERRRYHNSPLLPLHQCSPLVMVCRFLYAPRLLEAHVLFQNPWVRLFATHLSALQRCINISYPLPNTHGAWSHKNKST
jgi:hypothetical protein